MCSCIYPRKFLCLSQLKHSIIRKISGVTVSKDGKKISSVETPGSDVASGQNANERLLDSYLTEKKGKLRSHMYQRLNKFHSKKELAEFLKNAQVYKSGDVIALNKPYGLAKDIPIPNSKVMQTLNASGFGIEDMTFMDVLPLLMEMYGVDHLDLVSQYERWTSGLVILSSSASVRERLRKAIVTAKTFKKPHMTFLCVAIGKPSADTHETKVGLQSIEVKDMGKIGSITRTFSINSVKRGDVKPVYVSHKLVFYNPVTDASLVEVSVTSIKWHFVRMWMAHCCSPVLGDNIHGGFVRRLQDKAFLLSPRNMNAYKPPMIPRSVLRSLELSEGEHARIPCHTHFVRCQLPAKKPLVLEAPPPAHFVWTCRRLGLQPAGYEHLFPAGGDAEKTT